MAFEAENQKVVFKFTFTDLLALITVLACLCFQFYAGFFLTKIEMKDNTTLIQILTNISNYIMLILTFYFGSNLLAAKQASGQAQQINEMQKTATELAATTASATIAAAGGTAAATEVKVERIETLEDLEKELAKWEPESKEALEIVEKMKKLEKKS